MSSTVARSLDLVLVGQNPAHYFLETRLLLPAGSIVPEPQHRFQVSGAHSAQCLRRPRTPPTTRLDDPFARISWHLSEEDTTT